MAEKIAAWQESESKSENCAENCSNLLSAADDLNAAVIPSAVLCKTPQFHHFNTPQNVLEDTHLGISSSENSQEKKLETQVCPGTFLGA